MRRLWPPGLPGPNFWEEFWARINVDFYCEFNCVRSQFWPVAGKPLFGGPKFDSATLFTVTAPTKKTKEDLRSKNSFYGWESRVGGKYIRTVRNART